MKTMKGDLIAPPVGPKPKDGEQREDDTSETLVTEFLFGKTGRKNEGTVTMASTNKQQRRQPVVTVRRPINGGKSIATSVDKFEAISTHNMVTTKGKGSKTTNTVTSTSTTGMKKPPPPPDGQNTDSSLKTTQSGQLSQSSSIRVFDLNRRPLKKRLSPPAPRNLFGQIPTPPQLSPPMPPAGGLVARQSSGLMSVESATPFLHRFTSSSSAMSTMSGSSKWCTQMLNEPLAQTPQALVPFEETTTGRAMPMKNAFPTPHSDLLRRSTATNVVTTMRPSSLSQPQTAYDPIEGLQTLQNSKGTPRHESEMTSRYRPGPLMSNKTNANIKTTTTAELLSMSPEEQVAILSAGLVSATASSSMTSSRSSGAVASAFSSSSGFNDIVNRSITLAGPGKQDNNPFMTNPYINNPTFSLPCYSFSNTFSFTPVLKRFQATEDGKVSKTNLESKPAAVVSASAVTKGKSLKVVEEQMNKTKNTTTGRLSRGGDPLVELPHLFFDVPFTTRQCKCGGTKCLKLYCECFHSGTFCDPSICKCTQCKNTPKHNSIKSPRGVRVAAILALLSKKPNAFCGGRNNNTAGCRCKKSGCLKKYCECVASGKHCGHQCTCVGCNNQPDGDDTS